MVEWWKMSLNIKNHEADRLAHELADLTGESLTTAVTEALRERLERKRRVGLAERVVEIGREIAATIPEPYRSTPHGNLLYDERGLPK